MSLTPSGEEPRGAEGRVVELLGLLRSDPPGSEISLRTSVMRRARWQRAIQPSLRALGLVAGALGDGVRLLLATSGRPSGRSGGRR